MNHGWIKLHRSMQDHWLWDESRKYSKAEAWLDILMTVNHAEGKFVYRGKLFMCGRGELLRSLDKLRKRWGWSKSAAVRFLKLLEEDGMITLKSETVLTRVTVCNYRDFQDKRNDSDTQPKRARNAGDTKQGTYKKNKNEENENNDKETHIKTPAIAWSMTDGWSGISDKDYSDWSEAYPACDTPRQLASANQWLLSNPSKAKKKQWRRFITGWLSRQQERGGDAASNKPAKQLSFKEIDDAKRKEEWNRNMRSTT